jgi:hypothetical protein
LTEIDVASSTGIVANDYVEIDNEITQVAYVNSSTVLTVVQGTLGTTETTHSSGAAAQDILDWVYLSVTATGSNTGCTGACLYNFSTTTTTSPTGSTAGIAAAGGASGVVIDNSSTTQVGGEQIYYSTLTGDTAVQASQSVP